MAPLVEIDEVGGLVWDDNSTAIIEKLAEVAWWCQPVR